MIRQFIKIILSIFNPPILITIMRIIGYNRPYRVGILRLLPIFFKRFRPHYYSIIYEAAMNAISLNKKSISIIEFGVANGNGLLSIEKYAIKISKKFKIEIKVFGFDLGDSKGLPQTSDYRDLLYFWGEGEFKMNLDKLNKKIKFSKLILGDVKDTVKNFIPDKNSPIGAIFFDLDLYSSTYESFNIFKLKDEYILPRIICFFDDLQPHVNDYNGELNAINDFNIKYNNMKITKDYGLTMNYKYGSWAEDVFTFHKFDHKDYNKKVLNTLILTD